MGKKLLSWTGLISPRGKPLFELFPDGYYPLGGNRGWGGAEACPDGLEHFFAHPNGQFLVSGGQTGKKVRQRVTGAESKGPESRSRTVYVTLPNRLSQNDKKSKFWYATNPSGFHR